MTLLWECRLLCKACGKDWTKLKPYHIYEVINFFGWRSFISYIMKRTPLSYYKSRNYKSNHYYCSDCRPRPQPKIPHEERRFIYELHHYHHNNNDERGRSRNHPPSYTSYGVELPAGPIIPSVEIFESRDITDL